MKSSPSPGVSPLTVDGTHPFIVAGRFERGYVVCFTGTPIGEPGRGDVPFWDWNGWAPRDAERVLLVGPRRVAG